MLDLKEIDVKTYHVDGCNITTAIFTHKPSGIYVKGEDTNVIALRSKLIKDLDVKLNCN